MIANFLTFVLVVLVSFVRVEIAPRSVLGALLQVRLGTATTFCEADDDTGNPQDVLACDSTYHLKHHDIGAATYLANCGEILTVYSVRTGNIARIPVLDRGPRRTRVSGLTGDKLIQARALQETDLDLTHGAAAELGWAESATETILWWRDSNEQRSSSIY